MVSHLDSKALRRGVFLSVADLQLSIDAFLQAWNRNPKPFVWTATVESIQEKLTRSSGHWSRSSPAARVQSRKRKKRLSSYSWTQD